MRKWLQSWDLLTFHAGCALRAEFSRYHLHFIWWLMDPLFNLAVLYVVFGVFLPGAGPNFALFLLTGLVLWQWFGNTVGHATTSIYGAMRMFQQFRVHPLHFPLCVFVQDLAKYIPVFLVFLLAMAIFSPLGPSLLWLNVVPVMLTEGLFIIGCAVLVAALVPFVPDLAVVVPIVIQTLFFASGIFFNIDEVVLPHHRAIMYLNPNAVCIKALRNILIDGQLPDWSLLAEAALIGLTILLIGVALVTRFRSVYPRLIEQ